MTSLVLQALSRAAGTSVQPGDRVDVDFDYAMVHDGSAVLAQKYIDAQNPAALWRPERIFLVFDHIWPPNNERTARIHGDTRAFARTYGVRFYDGGNGICHQLLLEETGIEPGSVLAGGDSHTTTIGARGVVGIGFGAMDMANIMMAGKTWLKIPEIIRLNLDGQMPEGVSAKDVALGIAGRFGTRFATYRAIEYAGDFPFTLSDKAVLCNMATEFGAKTAVFIPQDWDDAADDEVIPLSLDLTELEPLVALPHSVGNVEPVRSVDTKIDVAFVGTCTGGRLEDFRAAAEAMAGQPVSPDVRLLVCPASKRIYKAMCKEGLIETFLDSGATILPPGCGPCLGMHSGVLGPGEACVSTANRNFVGRMGSTSAEIYLVSPATAAYSAVEGHIASPSVPHQARWHARLQSVPEPAAGEKKELSAILDEIGFDAKRNRIWEFGNNIDTDLVIAGKWLRTTDETVWRDHALESVNPEFTKEVKEGDVIVAGENFGCGSSREQAAIALKLTGIKAIIAKSCARIFYRNCTNLGLDIY